MTFQALILHSKAILFQEQPGLMKTQFGECFVQKYFCISSVFLIPQPSLLILEIQTSQLVADMVQTILSSLTLLLFKKVHKATEYRVQWVLTLWHCWRKRKISTYPYNWHTKDRLISSCFMPHWILFFWIEYIQTRLKYIMIQAFLILNKTVL